MTRLACISVDLDGLPHYCRIHGLSEHELPPAGLTAVGRRAPERFLELFDRRNLQATFFAIGEDLGDGATAMALAEAARLGHEIGNHSYSHDYALSLRPARAAADEVRKGGEAIEKLVGRRPVGFRAPGYALSPALFEALEDQGYAYDSSVFPSAPYFAAKAVVRGALSLFGRRSASIQDAPDVLLAPHGPYRPDPRRPYRRGRGKLVELPVATAPVTGFPFIGTSVVSLPKPAAAGLYRAMRLRSFLNFELHGIDLLDENDGASRALARRQRDLRIPAAAKRQRLSEVLDWIQNDFEIVTLEEAARRLAPSLGSR